MFKIVNYGFGNIYSILNMFDYLGIKAKIINTPKDINQNDNIILPGVGSYDNAVKSLKNLGFYEVLKNETRQKNINLIGICLGMQLMCEGSEEGDLEGLSLINTLCKKFSNETFIGWSKTIANNNFENKGISKYFFENNRFYFLHSYYVPINNDYSLLIGQNDTIEFTAALNLENLYGFQFHPERSHKFGMNVFKNLNKILNGLF